MQEQDEDQFCDLSVNDLRYAILCMIDFRYAIFCMIDLCIRDHEMQSNSLSVSIIMYRCFCNLPASLASRLSLLLILPLQVEEVFPQGISRVTFHLLQRLWDEVRAVTEQKADAIAGGVGHSCPGEDQCVLKDVVAKLQADLQASER